MFKPITRINVWGDSVLKGVVYDETRKRYRTVEDNNAVLISKETGLDIQNNARFGLTAPKARDLMMKALEKGVNCEAAIIELGGNDSDFNWAEVAEHPERQHNPNTPLDFFRTCITDMVEALRRHGIIPVLVNLPPIDAEKYFAWITRTGLNSSNILRWLGDVQRIYRYHECYSLTINNLARTLKCDMIDVRESFLLEMHYSRLLCVDGIHPNREGYKFMNRAFSEYVHEHVLI